MKKQYQTPQTDKIELLGSNSIMIGSINNGIPGNGGFMQEPPHSLWVSSPSHITQKPLLKGGFCVVTNIN